MSPKFRQEDGYTLPPPTSVSVLMINAQGMMLSVLGQDYFVSYNRVPWLRDARISSALNVRMAGPNAIEWPELDVDLEIESLKHPERTLSVGDEAVAAGYGLNAVALPTKFLFIVSGIKKSPASCDGFAGDFIYISKKTYQSTCRRYRTGYACTYSLPSICLITRQGLPTATQNGASANPHAVFYLDGQGIGAAYFLAFCPILHHAFVYFRGMGGGIYLHIGSNQHIAAEHLTQQGLLALRVGIIRGIELCQQPPCAQNCLYYLWVSASNERFARQAFLVFRFHHGM